MEALNIKLKDIIQFAIYLVMFVGFLITMDNKIDKLAENLHDLKTEKKEGSAEQRQDFQIVETKLENLGVTAELNKQNIELNKADIDLINIKLDRILNKE